MNKLKMAAVQERLKLKRVQIDTWTTREKLCLASAVLRSGDQNWVSVSRTLRSFDDLNRPPDWFSQKNCALQYSSLLEKVDTPKRKRGERGEVHVETPGESIVRKLTSERVEELKKSIEVKRSLHRKLQEEIALVRSGQADDKLDDMLQEIEEEKRQKKREAEIQAEWLKAREEKLLEIKRAWKPPAGFSSPSAAASASANASSPHQQRDPESGTRRSSSQSEQSSEAESLVDSPLSEPLQVDVIGDESLEGQVDVKPSSLMRESSPQPNSTPSASSAPATPTPTSPLLTSLLKSPSQVPSLQASSILHSAITAQRGSSPTITSLLNSSPAVPVSGSGALSPSVSGGVKSLVSTSISDALSEEHSEKSQSVQPTTSSAGAPTLSLLLGLPPSLPGKPLPEIPCLSPKVPSTAQKENISSSPVPSPPPSPQPKQESLPEITDTDPPAPVKEGESEKEESTKTEELNSSSEDLEKEEVKSKVDQVEKEKGDDSMEQQSDKSNLSTSVEVKEKTTDTKEHTETPVEETKVGAEVISEGDHNDKTEEPDSSEIKSERTEETVEKEDDTKAAEIEPTSDNKSLTDVPQTKFPEQIEAPKSSSLEVRTEEVSQETPNAEKLSPTDVEKDVSSEDALPKESSKTAEDPTIMVTSEESPPISEIKPDTPKVDELEKKTETEEILEKTAEESEVTIKEEEKQSQVLKSNEADESLSSEMTPVSRKSETVPESANEEENVTDRGPGIESALSGSESVTPDSQLRRRGGNRGRRSRGRALTMYRMRQEKIAKERIEKEKDDVDKTLDNSTENASKEPVTAATVELEDGKDKTETRKENVVDDEIKNLKSEWDEDTAEDVAEDSKKDTGTSQKKLKAKKVDGAGDEDKQKAIDVKVSKKPETEAPAEVSVETKISGKDGKVSEEEHVPVTSKMSEVDDSPKELSDKKDKRPEDDVDEDEPLQKILETKFQEDEETEKKDRTERKNDEKRLPDKKSDSKGKLVSSDKKVDEKEKKKLRDYKGDRKDKKVEGEKKEAELSAKEEESGLEKPEEKRIGKEKIIETKDRKSIEKHVEAVDKKQAKEKKPEEKEEKISGEKRISEKGNKDPEAKKIEGERKLSRDKKSEEREKRGLSEKKAEDVKKKVVEEKKTEEVKRSKPSEKEAVLSSKKTIHAPEKLRTPSTPLAGSSVVEKLKRKFEALEEDSSPADRIGPSEAKQAKRSEEVSQASESDKEINESEKKAEEESMTKRKMDRRKVTLSRRLDMDESSNKDINIQAEEKEKIGDSDSTPKASVGRRRGTGSISLSSTPAASMDQVPHSPASSQSLSEEERDYRAWKKAILLVWSRLATHKYASIFLRPITNDQAPGYHNVVFRPIDLYSIKKNVENGVIRTTAHFQRDVMLMFLNAIMYNSSDHDVHRMSVKMQEEGLQHIQILLEASEAPKILRRETREGNKRTDSSSQMHFTPSSHDEASAGATPASSSHTQAAEIAPFITSEDEMSESECHLSYIISRQKMDNSGDFSGGALPSRFHKGPDENVKKKKNEEDSFLDLNENQDAEMDGGSSAEDSNSSDNEDEKLDAMQSANEIPKMDVIKKEKEGKLSAAAQFALDHSPDADLGEEQLSSSQFGDHEAYADEMEKKQIRRYKRSMNESLISSEDSSSIPDDSCYWPNVMSIKGEKGDDTESVSSSIYKRRRVQRKSTNSDPDSLTEAPTFHFSPNSASLEESDYQAWKRLVLFIWDQLADHEYATIFMTPVRTDEAPRYYNVVNRPMDLGTIRKNVEKGLVRCISHFQRDVMLMFANALMYNPSHHDVHHKTALMQKECLQYLQVLVQESAEDPEVFRHEIREANNKIHSTGLDDMTAFASKSDSLSSEDQLSYSLTTGKVLETAVSDKSSYLKGSPSNVNEKNENNSIGKKPAVNVISSPAFSTRKRTSTYDSM